MERNFVKKQIIFLLFFIQFCFLYSLPFTHYTSDYLREAIQNSNYADLAIKYAPGANFDVVTKYT